MEQMPNEESRRNVFETIKEIETIVDCGFKIPPFTGTVVSSKAIMSEVEKLKKQIKVELEEADHVLNIKDKIISDAHEQANEIVKRREREISKQTIIQEAEGIARKVLEEAHKEAKRVREETTKFKEDLLTKVYLEADNLFNELERDLTTKRQNIIQNRKELQLLKQGKSQEEQMSEQF